MRSPEWWGPAQSGEIERGPFGMGSVGRRERQRAFNYGCVLPCRPFRRARSGTSVAGRRSGRAGRCPAGASRSRPGEVRQDVRDDAAMGGGGESPGGEFACQTAGFRVQGPWRAPRSCRARGPRTGWELLRSRDLRVVGGTREHEIGPEGFFSRQSTPCEASEADDRCHAGVCGCSREGR